MENKINICIEKQKSWLEKCKKLRKKIIFELQMLVQQMLVQQMQMIFFIKYLIKI
jgi:hypothetical protein